MPLSSAPPKGSRFSVAPVAAVQRVGRRVDEGRADKDASGMNEHALRLRGEGVEELESGTEAKVLMVHGRRPASSPSRYMRSIGVASRGLDVRAAVRQQQQRRRPTGRDRRLAPCRPPSRCGDRPRGWSIARLHAVQRGQRALAVHRRKFQRGQAVLEYGDGKPVRRLEGDHRLGRVPHDVEERQSVVLGAGRVAVLMRRRTPADPGTSIKEGRRGLRCGVRSTR